jgi:hypothetical protein
MLSLFVPLFPLKAIDIEHTARLQHQCTRQMFPELVQDPEENVFGPTSGADFKPDSRLDKSIPRTRLRNKL